MALKTEVADFINAHAEKVVSEAKTVLETGTNKEIDIQFQEATEFDFAQLSTHFEDSVVAISFILAADPEGLFQVFIDKGTAARIGSLMIMAEDENPELNEEHVAAIQEAVNQALGSLSTNLPESIGVPLSFDNIKGEVSEFNAESFTLPDLISAKISLAIAGGDAATLVAVMTSSSVEALLGEPAGAEEAATDVDKKTEAAAGGGESEDAEAGAEPGEPTAEAELSAEELAEISEAMGGEPEAAGAEKDVPGVLAEEGPERAPAAAGAAGEEEKKLVFLMDLKFPVSIELGRTKMLIKDILELGHGSVIEFDKLANEPVDLLVNDKKIAEGEVVIIDEHFGIKITQLIKKEELIKGVSRQ